MASKWLEFDSEQNNQNKDQPRTAQGARPKLERTRVNQSITCMQRVRARSKST